MDFKEFCTIAKKWKEQGIKLKIKDLNTNETDNVISYEVREPNYQNDTIISLEVKPSYAHMICEKDKCNFKEIGENLYEVKVADNHYQIIIE